MTSIKLTVTGAQIWASVTGVLTSGMVGIPVMIEYDEAWDGLTKNLICRCSPWGSDEGEIRTHLNVGEASTVAHEVMQQGMYLYLGVEGFRADGTMVIPTTWAKCGKIEYGANTCDDPSTDPELTVWNQLQAEMEETKKYVLTPEQATNIQAYAQEARQAAEEAKQMVASGLYYIPTVSQPTDNTLKFAFTPSITGVPIPKPVTVVLPVGEDSGQNVTKEITTTISVGSDPVVLDSAAPEQVVNLAWAVNSGRTVPAFTNYFIEKSDISYPRVIDTSTYTGQFFSTVYHGNEATFVAGNRYFCAMRYRMDEGNTAKLHGWNNFITSSGSDIISGSGWAYGQNMPTAPQAAAFSITKTDTGFCTVDYVYCINITAMQEAGTLPADITIAELVEMFGELPLVPGQDYPGGTIGDGTATLSINRGGEINTVDNSSSTATVKGGDILSVEGGSVTFTFKILKTVAAGDSGIWEGIKWVAFGDSLTDGSINADTKYHKLIAGKTGITVVDMGKGGTGYWRRSDEGNAFYQRMENVPADADIITIFGTINDWIAKINGVEYGTATDTIEAGTLAGYINECIDVAQRRAPYARIALITPLDYHGIPDDTMEAIANIIVAVARARKIKCLDLYHESGFRVDDPTFAAVYCTDYSETADTYGHPSNLAHEKIIAPEFMELLRRMILTA